MAKRTVSVAYEDPRFSKKEAAYWKQVRDALDAMGAPNSGELLHNSKTYVEGVHRAGLPAIDAAAVIWHKHCQSAGTAAVPCVAEDREEGWVLLEPGMWEWRTRTYPPSGYAIIQLTRKKGFQLGRWDSTIGKTSFAGLAIYPSLEAAQGAAGMYAMLPGGMEANEISLTERRVPGSWYLERRKDGKLISLYGPWHSEAAAMGGRKSLETVRRTDDGSVLTLPLLAVRGAASGARECSCQTEAACPPGAEAPKVAPIAVGVFATSREEAKWRISNAHDRVRAAAKTLERAEIQFERGEYKGSRQEAWDHLVLLGSVVKQRTDEVEALELRYREQYGADYWRDSGASEARDSAPAVLNPLNWSQWANKYGSLSGPAKIASDAANKASSEAAKSSNYNAYMEAYKLHIAARTAILAYKEEARRSAELFYTRDFEDLSDAKQKALVKEFQSKTDPVFDRLDQIADEHDRIKDEDLQKYKKGRDASGAWEISDSAPATACVPFTRLERNNEAFAACQAIAKGPLEDDAAMYRLLSAQLGKEDQEVFVVVGLDLHRNLRSYTEVARGQRDRVAVNVEDVLRAAILDGPHGFVVAHNHPSGKANPSPADRDLTKRIRAGAAVGCPSIVFLDHIVVGQGEYFSFADNKLKKVR